jgi:hypothetical protein
MSVVGYDPLEGMNSAGQEVLSSVAHRSIINILKCYTGFYDLFAESIQNALDAIERKHIGSKQSGQSYTPKLWVRIDHKERLVRIVDNGVGMDEEQFKLCFAPNVSFKGDMPLRGQKGVGATFLAYGFDYVKLQTKRPAKTIAAVFRGGRSWAEDGTGKVPRPRFEDSPFDAEELSGEESGTSIEIRLTGASAERPRRLDWQGAHTADQWLNVLRIKSPLGGVYLETPPFRPYVVVTVVDSLGEITSVEKATAEYYYPHEIPNIKVKELDEIIKKLAGIPGDPQTQFRKLPDEFKKLDCVYELWTPASILDPDSSLGLSTLDEDQRALINFHDVHLYGAFVDSVKLWDEFNDDTLGLRQRNRILRGGLQMASDFMVQGDLITIPLNRAIGYQNNTHVIVHFRNGNPDLGRKTFQPECHDLAERLATQAVRALTRYRNLLRPDTGSSVIIPDKDLHEWKKDQEKWRDGHPMAKEAIASTVSILSEPRQEQDVIALYHQLVGAGVIKGIGFFCSTHSDRYDSLFELNYSGDMRFDVAKCPLAARGVSGRR